MATRTGSRPPRKIFHKIGEVCDLTKTEPYVLRYWESEFPFLAPEKNRAGQRIYTDEDIETVLAIKRLLYEEGYTTAGARRRLEKEREDRASGIMPAEGAASGAEAATARAAAPAKVPEAAMPAPPSDDLRQALRAVRSGLRELRSSLSARGSESGVAESTEDPEKPEKPRRGRK